MLPLVESSLPWWLRSKESTCNAGDAGVIRVRKIPWRRNRLPTPLFLGFPCGSGGKESACNVRDLSSIPGLGSRGEGKGYPFQYSGLENSTDCIIHGVAKSQTGLSDFPFTQLSGAKSCFLVDLKEWQMVASYSPSS